jgi:hypothetical protein
MRPLVDCPEHLGGRHSELSAKRSVKARNEKKPDRQRPAENSILCTSAEENEDPTMPANLICDERVGNMQGCDVLKPYIYSARLVKF